MRNLTHTLTFIAVMLAIVISCKKDNGPVDKNTALLIGKWKLNASLLGTGSSLWETAAPNDNHIIIFNANGSLGGNSYTEYNKYKVTDSLLTFSKAASEERMIYTIQHDTLIIRPAGPILCTEGCAVRFIKQ